jgi:hypothetical protein
VDALLQQALVGNKDGLEVIGGEPEGRVGGGGGEGARFSGMAGRR